jgi:hypothetical protein
MRSTNRQPKALWQPNDRRRQFTAPALHPLGVVEPVRVQAGRALPPSKVSTLEDRRSSDSTG